VEWTLGAEGDPVDDRSSICHAVVPINIEQVVAAAAAGDMRAWNRLVDQYARLIWSITAEFRLGESDAADVVQTTWLRLLEHINDIVQPAKVGSWLAVTARRECLRIVAARKRVVLGREVEDLVAATPHDRDIDEGLLAAERARDVRRALSRLPRQSQRLLEMLMADPPISYAQISDELGLPVGSIGPTRGRCLARLRLLLQTA
jgi:RNA polymerase sigma factor (sigma-70 family)